MSKAGIYKIENQVNGKLYIGSSKRLDKRWKFGHRSDLRHNRHHNDHLQSSWNKYGSDKFTFEVIMYCSEDKQEFYEQRFLDCYIDNNIWDQLYNIEKKADHTAQSEESIQKMLESRDYETGENHHWWNGGDVELECKNCGGIYKEKPSRKGRSKFCSRSCQGKHQGTGENSNWWRGGEVTIECENCGDEFKVDPYREEKAKYCSRECANEGIDRPTGEDHPSWNGGKVEIECNSCHEVFKVIPSRANTAKFCSQECMRVDKIEQNCENCRDTYKVYPSNTDSKFCSKECMYSD